MFKEWLQAFLQFHRKERRGFGVLMILLLVVVCYNGFLRLTFSQRAESELIKFGPSIAKFNADVAELQAEAEDFRHSPSWESGNRQRPEAERFPFDPNTLDSAGWVRLGFSPKQSAAILKFRNRGGTFRKKEDLMKLFMVDSALYLELQPFITIEPREDPIWDKPISPRYERLALPMVDINRADTLEMENIRGIGASFARRIYRYRERLGGFRTSNQLLEVFGMDTARFEDMLPQITIDTTVRSRININTADYTELIRHPYLDKNQVRAIIRYREQHGAYRSVNDLRNIHIIKEDDYKRLAPYLSVD
jgi:competence protein ComEA